MDRVFLGNAPSQKQIPHTKVSALRGQAHKSLLKLWPAVFRFIDVEGLEPTNNFAEQAVRPRVILRKLSQGTRSDMGSLCIARVMSVTATCRKQDLDILDYMTLDYMTDALAAHWHGIPPPPLLMRS